MWFFIFFLIVIMMFLVVFAIIGDTIKAPFSWGSLALLFGSAYAWIIDSYWNFNDFILVPAWQTITFEIVPGVYEFGAVIFVIGIFIYIISMARTAYVSWTREGLITLSA